MKNKTTVVFGCKKKKTNKETKVKKKTQTQIKMNNNCLVRVSHLPKIEKDRNYLRQDTSKRILVFSHLNYKKNGENYTSANIIEECSASRNGKRTMIGLRFDRYYYLWPSSFLFCWFESASLSLSLPPSPSISLARDSFKNGLPFPFASLFVLLFFFRMIFTNWGGCYV